MATDRDTLYKGLSLTLEKTDFDGLGKKYQGKVRDNYSTPDGKRIIITTDRISAFDRVLGTLPFKGQVLNQAAVWWFERTASLVPNHLLSAPDPNLMICWRWKRWCAPISPGYPPPAFLPPTTGASASSAGTSYPTA